MGFQQSTHLVSHLGATFCGLDLDGAMQTRWNVNGEPLDRLGDVSRVRPIACRFLRVVDGRPVWLRLSRHTAMLPLKNSITGLLIYRRCETQPSSGGLLTISEVSAPRGGVTTDD